MFPLIQASEDEDVEYFDIIAADFPHSASDDIYMGCIGALNGLAVRIKRPVESANLRDPGAYYCRKKFLD
jgi:hypothetical protein